MKKVHLLLIMLFSVFIATGLVEAKDKDRDMEHELEMMGDLSSPEAKSGTENPIKVYQTLLGIEADISENVGKVTITIYGSNGVVKHTETINTVLQREWVFNASILSKGSYKIEFKNTKRQHLTGNFTVK